MHSRSLMLVRGLFHSCSSVLFVLSPAVLLSMAFPASSQTPPVEPRITQTPLPPRVELPLPPAAQPDVPNRPLTADEAARIALAKQPDLAAARAAVSAAQGRSQQTRAAFAPQLGLDFGYSRVEVLSTQTTGATGGGSTGRSFVQPGYTASAGVQQLLFDFNHTRDLVRQAAQFELAAGANLTRAQQDLVLQVKQAFYDYVAAESLVAVNENNVRNRQGHVDLAQARLRAGLGPPIDVVRAQTAHSEAIGAFETARNSASQGRVDLALLMGVDPRTPISAADSDEPEPPSSDVNRLADEAMRQRPEIVQAAAVLQAAEHGVSAASTLNAPSFRASAVVVGRGQSLLPRNEFLTLGLGIQWDPFDGGRTAGRVREAKASVETARAELARMQQLVVSDVARAYLDLKTAEQRVTAAEAGVANAEEAVRLAEGRYRSGVGVFIDVLDAQSALLAARTARVNAQSSVDQARAAVKRAAGSR